MSLDPLAAYRTPFRAPELAHLERLVASWRILADLSFSDLLLFAPIAGEEGHRFVVLGQVRPVTGPTIYPADLVGTVVDEVERPLLARCWRTGELATSDVPALASKERARVACVPVRWSGAAIAVLTRESSPTASRRAGQLERVYLEVFDRFARMVAEGSFPFARDEAEVEGAPRVGDGVIVLDADLQVRFVSPNAVSALHRLGIHAYAEGLRLGAVGVDEEAVDEAARTWLPVNAEIERDDGTAALRAVPLLEAGVLVGVVVLVRDVTDLRRRDRMLLSKDATIREIHHRVKNNLQTIAALLRLQRRRLTSREAREALAESERRIRSIAIVHETLSRNPGGIVEFNEIVRPLVRVVEETVSTPDLALRFDVEGDAGPLPGEVATPLAVVLNELLQNAVDHGYPPESGRSEGAVGVRFTRSADRVTVDVVDDGVGLPEHFSIEESRGLGLSIVHGLVTGELAGSIEMRDVGGTAVHVTVPVETPRTELVVGAPTAPTAAARG